MQLDHWVVVDHEVEDPEEILEECSVKEEEEASFWDMSLVWKRKEIRLYK